MDLNVSQGGTGHVLRARLWQSVHLHFDGNIYERPCDDILQNVALPVWRMCEQAGLVSDAFVVRYSEGGPHLRLRLLAKDAATVTRIRSIVRRRCRLCAGRITRVQWTDYQPEYDRYGGMRVMPVVEHIFAASSRVACALLTPEVGPSRDRRLGHGLLASMALLHVFFGDEATAGLFASTYAQGYESMLARADERHRASLASHRSRADKEAVRLSAIIKETWRAFGGRSSVLSWMDRYRRALRRFRAEVEREIGRGTVEVLHNPVLAWHDYALRAGPSLLHMMNNRLGVSVVEEIYLTRLLAETLGGQHVDF